MYKNRIVFPGEMYVSSNPEDILIAYDLVSTLGIGMYNFIEKFGGIAHISVPEHLIDSSEGFYSYMEKSISSLLEKIDPKRARIHYGHICLVGGANRLDTIKKSTHFNIGTRSIIAAREILNKHHLNILKEEVGGNLSRTFRVYIGSGKMTCRTIGFEEKLINYQKQHVP